MKKCNLLLVLLGLLLCAAPVLADEDIQSEEGFKPLFDGKTLDGWKKVGGEATYSVEDGELVGRRGPGPNTFLRTEKTYGDFILKLEVKYDIYNNSGIQFRSHQRPGKNGRVFGYQCEIDPTPRAFTGGIYDEGRRKWLYPLEGMPEKQKAFKLDDWNEIIIKAVGPHIQTWVNGIPCTDMYDAMDLEGFIALQVHSSRDDGQIRWRNIRIKDMGETQWKPLWNGKDLSEFEKLGPGTWEVKDGVLHGTQQKAETHHTVLLTKKQYRNFTAKVKFKVNKGDSGFYFRAVKADSPGQLTGFQVEVENKKSEAGGLYEQGGRKWVAKPSEQAQNTFKDGKWNEIYLTAVDGRIVVHLNGFQSVELTDDPGSKKGHFALQLHGKQDMDVEFKDLKIIELD